MRTIGPLGTTLDASGASVGSGAGAGTGAVVAAGTEAGTEAVIEAVIEAGAGSEVGAGAGSAGADPGLEDVAGADAAVGDAGGSSGRREQAPSASATTGPSNTGTIVGMRRSMSEGNELSCDLIARRPADRGLI